MSVMEKTIAANAAKWNDAHIQTKVEKKRADDARHQYVKAQEKEKALRDVLAECVGQNIPRRCISMQNGSMVLVQLQTGGGASVSVEDLIR